MRTLILLLLMVSGAPVALRAQWFVGVEWTANRYGGTAHDTSGSHAAADARPAGGSGVSIRLTRHWQRVGFALRASYATPGFTVTGEGISVTDKTTGRLFETALLLSTRVGGIGPSGAVRAELGPALHLWDFNGEFRSRLGAVAGMAYEWPVAERFVGVVRLDGMVSKSWFDQGEVLAEFERRLTWRYGVTLALRYRL